MQEKATDGQAGWSAAEAALIWTAPPETDDEPLSAVLEELREEDGDR